MAFINGKKILSVVKTQTIGNEFTFVRGTINAGDGSDENAQEYLNTRARTTFIYAPKGTIFKFNNTFKYDYNINEYNIDKTYISDDGWTNDTYWRAYKDMYIRVVVKYSDLYLNLINRSIPYWHRNDIYQNIDNRLIFDLKDIAVGDTITVSSYDNQRFAITIFDQEYGYYTEPNPPYIYDSEWLTNTSLTYTIPSGAKGILLVWSNADNSPISSMDWLLNPNITIRKTNDTYISDSEIEALNNNGLAVGDESFLIVSENTKENNLIQWGHRGHTNYAPENTLPSFELAYKFGLRCMECDIKFTSDSTPVILHDTTINRTARNLDGSSLSTTINVSDLTLPVLKNNYDFGIWFSSLYKGTTIPTFEELVLWCKSKNCYLHLDLLGGVSTTSQLSIIYDILLKHNMQNSVMWEVNSTAFVEWLQAKDSNADIIYNPQDIISTANIDTMVNYNLKKLSTKTDTAYPVVKYALDNGIKVFIWGDLTNANLLKYYKYGASGFYDDIHITNEYIKNYIDIRAEIINEAE